MPDIDSAQFPMFAVRALGALLFAITFLQSGLDKLMNQQSNQSYIHGVFAKTPLKPASAGLFWAITVMEVATGVLCALGFLQLLFANKAKLAMYGVLLAAITLISLFGGQRIAKDYAGAAGLVPYILTSLFVLSMLASGIRF